MGRTAFVMAVVLWAAGARGAASPSAGVSQPLPPRIVPADRALAAAAATDSVWVGHSASARAVLVPGDLARRFRDLLLQPERVNPGVDPPEICTGCPDQLMVSIGFPTLATYSPRLEIMLFFREAQARYKTRDGWVGWSSIRPDRQELLGLVKRALPADSVVRRYRWSAGPDSLSDKVRLLPEFPYIERREKVPEATYKRPPVYPRAAIEAHVQGTVVVEVVVNEDGDVVDARILKSIPMLDDAAMWAVRQWVFVPARKDGRPFLVRVAIPVKFALH